ncbi:MAG: AbrB/MazE/SpoVT family DNA-binding domain-containing protein [Candidatus Marinimicrobia bacterium]|nr:AbrB/MazE/SpoVT family DNA-binding domain-containing protein [Candidatus Neomarinimicrobiota bacterium]
MLTVIQKWGNSLALRLPKSFTKEVKVEAGSQVDLTLDGEKLIITPIKEEKEYKLDSFLSEITPSSVHEEVDFGESVGKEWLE